jgi:SpoVK/Ycf46/Vps4 family AAA+-type ATPase
MTTDDMPPLLHSLLAVLAASPNDAPLRVHVATMLLDAGKPVDALEHCSAALRLVPGDPDAIALLNRITGALTGSPPDSSQVASPRHTGGSVQTLPPEPEKENGFDWEQAEQQMARAPEPAGSSSTDIGSPVERPEVRLADVGGMDHVKREIEVAFLLPMAQPELRAAYGASAGGGLLLYGPPGCGKTFIARALAGELGASFVGVSLADVLDMWLGQSEKNMRALFEQARAHRPAVIFLDEVDAIGQKRSNLRANPAARGTVNQLLYEMDGTGGSNEGVYVLAATNQPWDVDPALRRPGRFDRTLFVSPPDRPARMAILQLHLRGRPTDRLDLTGISDDTEGYSGADLAHLCNLATRTALADAARSGEIRPIGSRDLDAARQQISPSTLGWFSAASHAATFANQDGTYDDLVNYLKRHKL